MEEQVGWRMNISALIAIKKQGEGEKEGSLLSKGLLSFDYRHLRYVTL